MDRSRPRSARLEEDYQAVVAQLEKVRTENQLLTDEATELRRQRDLSVQSTAKVPTSGTDVTLPHERSTAYGDGLSP